MSAQDLCQIQEGNTTSFQNLQKFKSITIVKKKDLNFSGKRIALVIGFYLDAKSFVTTFLQ